MIFQKVLFFIIMVMGVITVISSTNWLGCWMGMEINLMFFLSFIINKISPSCSSSIIYFLFQAMASVIFIMSVSAMKMYPVFNKGMELFNMILLVSLMMKMGAAPLHFWLPAVMANLSWMNILVLMTLQKLAPMILFSYVVKSNLVYLFIFSSAFFGGIGGLNQTNLRVLFSFSSVNQLSWMLMSVQINEIIFKYYFFTYVFMSLILIYTLFSMKVDYISQFYSLNFKNLYACNMLGMLFLSMAGMPPLLGFFQKMLIIKEMMYLNLTFLTFILLLMSLLVMFFYLRILYSSFLMSKTSMKILSLSNTPSKMTQFSIFWGNLGLTSWVSLVMY